jgi:hypothetical protein
MAINWTHFDSQLKQCRSTQGNIGLGMFPIWSLACDILPYDWVAYANMHWKMKLNMFDLDFGRIFSGCNEIFLRTIIGFRLSLINQKFDVNYGGGIFANGLNLPDLDSTFGFDRIKMKQNFWAIGPRVGIEPQLNLGKGWRFYASACATLDYSFFNVHQKEIYLKNVRFDCKHSPQGFRWIIDSTAGILWKTLCCHDHYALTFSLGWEYHIFFKQVEFRKDAFNLVSHDRNLSLNGLSISARFDF